MDRVTEITAPVFNALAELRRTDPSALPSAAILHQQMCTYLDQIARLGPKLGLTAQDTTEIRYALVALIDETLLSFGSEVRELWLAQLLQLKYFGENVAGDVFFERLAVLRRDPSRTEALKVYYLCLMFGFKGRYRIRGGELELLDITDAVRNELVRAQVIPSDATLSPNGSRPYEPIADRRRNLLLLWLAVGATALSALVYVWLRLSLVDRADRMVERLTAFIGA